MFWFGKLKIAQKLPLLVAGSALVSVAAIGISNYLTASAELEAASERQLTALAAARKQALESYLGGIREDLLIMGSNETIKTALVEFTGAFAEVQATSGSAMTELQRQYITDNPNPTGQKERLDRAKEDTEYNQLHGRFHPWFRKMLQARDYYDIFLFSPNGDLVFTVFKELDYATNMMNGQWRDTDLANVFRGAKDSATAGSVTFIDFAAYAPSHGAAASFISTPIFQGGRFIGVLAFQMPVGRINRLMQVYDGFGESGETYLVGKDLLMRSDSRFSEESTILKTEVPTATVKRALAGETGFDIVPDYRGILVLSVYIPLDFEGVRWALMAEIDEAEIRKPTDAMRNVMLMIGLVVLLIVGIVGFIFARGIAGPLTRMTAVMRELAAGDKTVEITGARRKDELGDMANAVTVFKENMIEKDNLVEARDAERERTEQRLLKLTISRTKFLAAASHDLRQPLHAMALYLPVLEEEANGEPPDEAVRAIRNACDTMGILLDTLLDMSKLDSGTIKPKTGRVPIADLFDQLAMEFGPQASAKSLELRIAPTSAWGITDATLLLRILRNFLTNAIHYTPSGKVLLGLRRRAGWLRIEVWDTGIGIAEDDLRQIFAEFYQAADGGSKTDRTLGLGLSIVERLADLLDHRIDAWSQFGNGSGFCVEVQQANATELHNHVDGLTQVAQRNVAGLRAVLVEDNPAVLTGMEALLGRWGCEVLAADTVDGAVGGVVSGAYVPDIILADLQLSGGETGLQAIEQIRKTVKFPTPAIIITATTDPDGLREAAASGCMILHKPLNPDQLRTAIETTLSHSGEIRKIDMKIGKKKFRKVYSE